MEKSDKDAMREWFEHSFPHGAGTAFRCGFYMPEATHQIDCFDFKPQFGDEHAPKEII